MWRKYFFLLLMCGMGSSWAYGAVPGDVKSPLLWLKTDAVDKTLPDGDYQWYNMVDPDRTVYDYKDGKAKEPVSRAKINTYNFNPAIPFYSTDPWSVDVQGVDLSQMTVFGVYGFTQPENYKNTMLYKVEGEKGVLLTRNKLFHTKQDVASTSFQFQGFISNGVGDDISRVKIIAYERATTPDFSIWASKDSKIDLGTAVKRTGDMGEYPVQDPEGQVQGFLSELIAYGRALEESDRQVVETYLAFKYGISLDGVYMTRWKDKIDMGWGGNRVFAYGRDDKSAFSQQYATTSYEENVYGLDDTYFNHSSLNKSSEYNLLVAGFTDNSQMVDSCFVVIGDNNAGTKPAQLKSDATAEEIKAYKATYQYMPREWMVNVINPQQEAPHTVELGYNLTEDAIFGYYVDEEGAKTREIFLVVSSNPSDKFEASNTGLVYYPVSAVDAERKKVIFNNVKWDNPEMKFTFAYKGEPNPNFKPTFVPNDKEDENIVPIKNLTVVDEMEIKENDDKVKDVKNETAFKWYMYSNPKNEEKQFAIRLEMDEPEPVSFLVFDMMGRYVTEVTMRPDKGESEKIVKVPAKGVYAVDMITKKTRNTFSGKILIK